MMKLICATHVRGKSTHPTVGQSLSQLVPSSVWLPVSRPAKRRANQAATDSARQPNTDALWIICKACQSGDASSEPYGISLRRRRSDADDDALEQLCKHLKPEITRVSFSWLRLMAESPSATTHKELGFLRPKPASTLNGLKGLILIFVRDSFVVGVVAVVALTQCVTHACWRHR